MTHGGATRAMLRCRRHFPRKVNWEGSGSDEGLTHGEEREERDVFGEGVTICHSYSIAVYTRYM